MFNVDVNDIVDIHFQGDHVWQSNVTVIKITDDYILTKIDNPNDQYWNGTVNVFGRDGVGITRTRFNLYESGGMALPEGATDGTDEGMYLVLKERRGPYGPAKDLIKELRIHLEAADKVDQQLQQLGFTVMHNHMPEGEFKFNDIFAQKTETKIIKI